jgi:hypothetical protein
MNMNRRSGGHVKNMLATLLVTLLTYGAGQEAVAAAAQNAPGPKRYDYDGVGAPDAAMVRRVATTLGPGKTVDVKTTNSKKLRAKIQSIDESGFTVTHGRSSAPVVIAYDEVTQLKSAGLRRAAKIAIGVGLAYGVPWLVWGLGCATAGCGQ